MATSPGGDLRPTPLPARQTDAALTLPPVIAELGENVRSAFVEFFAAHDRAAARSLAWVDARGLGLHQVAPTRPRCIRKAGDAPLRFSTQGRNACEAHSRSPWSARAGCQAHRPRIPEYHCAMGRAASRPANDSPLAYSVKVRFRSIVPRPPATPEPAESTDRAECEYDR